jgi:hypothetical protein
MAKIGERAKKLSAGILQVALLINNGIFDNFQ